MMRPQSLVLPPKAPTELTAAIVGIGAAATVVLTWQDNSLAETQTLVQVSDTGTDPWTTLASIPAPLDELNSAGLVSYTDAAGTDADTNFYRVVAQNTAGYGGEFVDLTAQVATVGVQVPAAPAASVTPTSLAFGNQVVATTSLPQTVTLSSTGRALLVINGIAVPTGFGLLNTTCGASLDPAASCTISVTFTPTDASAYGGNLTIDTNAGIQTVALSGTGVVQGPAAPTPVSIVRTNNTSATLSWTDASTNETSFQRQVSTDGGTSWVNLGAAVNRSATQSTAIGEVLNRTVTVSATTNASYRVLARAGTTSTPSAVVTLNNTVSPAAPSNVAVSCVRVTNANPGARCTVTWTDNSNNNTGFNIQRATNATFTAGLVSNSLTANTTTFNTPLLPHNTDFWFRVQAISNGGVAALAPVGAIPAPIRTP